MKIITGRASKDIDAPVLKRIKEIKSEDPFAPVIVITMRQATFITEKLILEKLGLSGMLGLDVLSFEKLTQKITDEVFGRALGTLDAAGRCMLFCNILSLNGEELRKLNSSGRRPEISKGLADLYNEFGNMDISYPDLKDFSAGDDLFRDKLDEISFAFEKFDDWCLKNEARTFDRANIAIEHIKDSEYIRSAHVFIMGCDVLTEQMIRYIAEIDLYARSVTASFHFDKKGNDRDVFSIPEKYIERLGEFCNAATEEAEEEVSRSEDLKHVEQYLFAYPYRQSELHGDVSVIKCLSPAREAMACCERAAELIGAGYSPSDIAVAAAGIGTYSKYLKKYFTDANIPYFLDEKRTLSENALSDFVMSALKLLRGRLTADRLLVHIRTGFLGSRETVDRISSVIRGRIKNVYRLKHKLSDPEEERARQECVKPVFNFIEKARKCSSQKALIEVLENYINACRADSIVKDMVDEQRRLGYDDSADYYEQVCDEITAVFSQLKILASGKADHELLYDMLRSAFESHAVSIIPVKAEAVFFGDVNQAKIHSVKCLMILGANEGLIPDYEESAGVLTYEEKNMLLKEIKDQIYPSALQRQKLFLYEMVTAPTDRLEFFYHVSDDKDMTPESVFVTKIKDMFGMSENDELSDKELIGRSLLSNAVDEAKASVGRMMRHDEYAGDRDKLSDLLADDKAAQMLKDYYNLGRDEIHDRIDPALAEKLYPKEGSVTGFEKFYHCPYAFFLEKGIKPFEAESPEMREYEVGDFMHGMLDTFFVKAKEQGKSIRELSVEEISRMTGDIAKEMAEKSDKELDDKESLALVGELKSEVDEYLSFLREEKMSSSSEVAMMEVPYDIDINGYKVKGRIDRIDMCEVGGQKYFSVIDYKTGKAKDFKLYDLYKGLLLQLAVYIIAADRLIGDARPAGAGYVNIEEGLLKEEGREVTFPAKGMHVGDTDIVKEMYGLSEADLKTVPGLGVKFTKDGKLSGVYKNRFLSEAELDTAVKYAGSLVKNASKQIKNGVIKDEPAENASGKYPCEYCKYRLICSNPREEKTSPHKEKNDEIISLMEKGVRDDA